MIIFKRLKNLLRGLWFLSNHNLWEDNENNIKFLSKKIVSDVCNEFKLLPNQLNILNRENSIDYIVNSKKSFVRTSDGEIKLILGQNQPFQSYNADIASCLLNILRKNQNPNLVVGINGDYFKNSIYISDKNEYKNEYENEFLIRYAFQFREFYNSNCSKTNLYIDSTFTFGKWGVFNEEMEMFWNKWKMAFKNKELVIVCGKGILDKLKYDVFLFAKSKKFIHCPKINAWDKKEEILRAIRLEDKQKLIIFILGMAGKAMIPELCDEGYVCWDVGHLAKSYNAFMCKMAPTPENISNFYSPD